MVQKLVYLVSVSEYSNILDRNMTISDFIMKKKKTFLRSHSQIQPSLFPATDAFKHSICWYIKDPDTKMNKQKIEENVVL